jgi:hypothetical protein
MIVITWNCKKFRERYEILKDNWDILIIQECNDPEQYDTIYKRWAKNDNQSLWEGDNKDRGLGIFVKKHIKIEDLREKKIDGEKCFNNLCIEKIDFDWSELPAESSKKLKYFLPVLINDSILLLGVYAKSPKLDSEQIEKLNKNKYEFRYMGQIHEYLKNNGDKFKNKQCIIAGDFNDNPSLKSCNKQFFKKTMGLFTTYHLKSAYHAVHGKNYGEEDEDWTFRHVNHKSKGQTDYIFVSENIEINK